MASQYETSIYTKDQLDSARTRGQIKGLIQGAISTFILLAVFNFLSWIWIPILILLGVLGITGFYRYRKKSKSDLS